jgi:hypothetical protein
MITGPGPLSAPPSSNLFVQVLEDNTDAIRTLKKDARDVASRAVISERGFAAGRVLEGDLDAPACQLRGQGDEVVTKEAWLIAPLRYTENKQENRPYQRTAMVN